MSSTSILIGIAGGTGSGKTSIANKLLEEYDKGDIIVIEQDAYYRDISNISIDDRHLHNFDHPDAIDIELFNQQLISLLKGQIVEMGDTETVLSNPQNEYTKKLISSIPKVPKLWFKTAKKGQV